LAEAAGEWSPSEDITETDLRRSCHQRRRLLSAR
jgi:hypothetical protein